MADMKKMMWDEFDQVESDLEKWKQKRQTPAVKPFAYLSHMDFKVTEEYPMTNEEIDRCKIKKDKEEESEKRQIENVGNEKEEKQTREIVHEKEAESNFERETKIEIIEDSRVERGKNKMEDSGTRFKKAMALFEGNSNISDTIKKNAMDFNRINKFSVNNRILTKEEFPSRNLNTSSEVVFRKKNIQSGSNDDSTNISFPTPKTTGKQFNRRSWAPGMITTNNLSIANDKEYTIEKINIRKKRNDIILPTPRFVPRKEVIMREKEEKKAGVRNQVISVNFDEDPKNFRISIDDFKNMIKSPALEPDVSNKLKEVPKKEINEFADVPKQCIVLDDVPKRTIELNDSKEFILNKEKKREKKIFAEKLEKDLEQKKKDNVKESLTSLSKGDIWCEEKKDDIFEDFEEVFQRQKEELEERKNKSPSYTKTNNNSNISLDDSTKINIGNNEKSIKNNIHDSIEKSNFIVNKKFEIGKKTFPKQSIVQNNIAATPVISTITTTSTYTTTISTDIQVTLSTTTNTSKADIPKVSKLKDSFLKESCKPLPLSTKPSRTNFSKNTTTTNKNENNNLNGANLQKPSNKTSQIINMFTSAGFKPALPGELPKRSKSLKIFESPKMTLKRPQPGISFDEEDSKNETSSTEIRRLDNSFYKTRLSIVKGTNRRPPSVFQAMIEDQGKFPRNNADCSKKQETLEDLESFLFPSSQALNDVPYVDVIRKDIDDIIEETEEEFV